VIFIGIYFNAGLDLGYSYLDGFISQYQEEYLNQSVLLIEVVVSISGIFIGGILSSKTNDFLIYYTADNYWSKFLFFLSRLNIRNRDDNSNSGNQRHILYFDC